MRGLMDVALPPAPRAEIISEYFTYPKLVVDHRQARKQPLINIGHIGPETDHPDVCLKLFKKLSK